MQIINFSSPLKGYSSANSSKKQSFENVSKIKKQMDADTIQFSGAGQSKASEFEEEAEHQFQKIILDSNASLEIKREAQREYQKAKKVANQADAIQKAIARILGVTGAATAVAIPPVSAWTGALIAALGEPVGLQLANLYYDIEREKAKPGTTSYLGEGGTMRNYDEDSSGGTYQYDRAHDPIGW